jgi:hypothetical protein
MVIGTPAFLDDFMAGNKGPYSKAFSEAETAAAAEAAPADA